MTCRLSLSLACMLLGGLCVAAPLPTIHKRMPIKPIAQPMQALQRSIEVGSLTLHRCPDAPGYCGSVVRALDPTNQVWGTIAIQFEYYPHTDQSQPALQPIMAAEGGPGYATTGSRDGYLGLFAPLRDRRDILLVDERGTGKSQALNCALLQGEPDSRAPGIQACSAQLGDTRYLYGSGFAADDVAAILDALGMPVINLYGDSYGTYFAQTFAGRHPDRLRSVVLDSAYPVRGLSPWYPEIAITARYAFDAACQRSPACSALPGTSMQRINALVASLRAHPFSGRTHDANGVPRNVTANATNLANLMVANATQSVVYRELDPAARALLDHGDPTPLLRLLAENQLTDTSGGVPSDPAAFSSAIFIAVSCQDYPQIYDMNAQLPLRHKQRNRALLDKQQTDPGVYAPFTIAEFDKVSLDTSVLDLCLGWEAPAVAPAYPPGEPVPPNAGFTQAPVLVMSGDLDSLTPALQGTQAAALFEHGRQLIVDNSFHVTAVGDQDNCASGIVQRFVRTLDPGDTTCAQHVAEVHLVPRFVHTAQELDPATARAGNQGTDVDLRVVAAAAQTLGDALARWWINYSGNGVGLRGGSFSYSSPSNLTFFKLNKMLWVDDVQVSGKMSWDYDYPGAVTAQIHVVGGPNETGDLTFAWNSHVPLAQATITGKIGGRNIAATMYAP